MFEEARHFFVRDACSLSGGNGRATLKRALVHSSNGIGDGGVNAVTIIGRGKEYYCLYVPSNNRSMLLSTRLPSWTEFHQQQYEQQQDHIGPFDRAEMV